ncbi:LOW QUALITY PROTEIN: hypothetical protein ACHAWC_001162 [Mediolabrus comicus]
MPKGKKRTRNNDEESSDAVAVPSPSSSAAAPITVEGEMPQKKFYRSRAHCNPLSFNEAFDYPTRPDLFDWTEEHYPDHPSLSQGSEKESSSGFNSQSASIRPDVLDVGCGFGGLTMALSPALPNNTILGLEIRSKVTEYIAHRCKSERASWSISKLFRNENKCNEVSTQLLPKGTEYAFLLKPEVGRLYCITDVKDLHNWHVEKCDAHPLFERLTDEEMEQDPCVTLMKTETEEGKKVKREGRFGHAMYYQVYKRVDESCPGHVKNVGMGSINAINFFEKGEFGVEVQ